MVVDVSIGSTLLILAQSLAFALISTIAMMFVYYPNEPFHGKVRNVVYAVIEIILFVLMYQIVEIKWLP